MSEEEKVMKALERDEREQQEIMEKLRAIAEEKIIVAVTIKGKEVARVPARILKDHELIEYTKELEKIDKRLATAQTPIDVPLSPEQNAKLYAIMDRLISKATGLSIKFLTELGDVRIRAALLAGIIRASVPSPGEIEQLAKFRPE